MAKGRRQFDSEMQRYVRHTHNLGELAGLDAEYFRLDGENGPITGRLETASDRVKSYETSTTTASMSDSKEIHFCNGSSPYTLTLPAHVAGKEIRINNIGNATVTLSPTSGTIKGSSTEVLLRLESLILISDGTNWL